VARCEAAQQCEQLVAGEERDGVARQIDEVATARVVASRLARFDRSAQHERLARRRDPVDDGAGACFGGDLRCTAAEEEELGARVCAAGSVLRDVCVRGTGRTRRRARGTVARAPA
jgi:hypothetical protein